MRWLWRGLQAAALLLVYLTVLWVAVGQVSRVLFLVVAESTVFVIGGLLAARHQCRHAASETRDDGGSACR